MVKIAEPMTDVGIRYIEDRKHYFQDWGTIEQLIARIRSLKSDLSTLKPEGEQISGACHCTLIEQDESCPVGYPSLLCDDCDGKGYVRPVSEQISGEAVERAARALAARELGMGDAAGVVASIVNVRWKEYAETARTALEAAIGGKP